MALINPKTGSARFNVVVRREAVVSLAGEVPVIVSEAEEFNMKLVSDVISGEEISHKDLQEVPDEEIGADGIWVHAQAAKLKQMTQEELIEMVLKLQAEQSAAGKPKTKPAKEEEAAPAKEEAEDTADEPADQEEPVEKKPKKKKKKKPAPVDEDNSDDEEGNADDEELDVAF
jgi:ribosomal protein L12E/L44/L45/RPP1/RPP2